MAILLSLFAALAYGLSDFIGGLLSRRTAAWSVAVAGTLSTTACTSLLAAFLPGDPTAEDFLWSLVAGTGSGAGVGFLYRGFATGRMSVVAPLSAVGAALVPVAVGLVTGERPSLLVWAGILMAFPAIWLVSTATGEEPAGSSRSGTAEGVVDGILAGLGFGVLFAGLGQIPDSAGFWPLAASQAVSVVAVVLLAAVQRAAWVPRDRWAWIALLAGPLGAAATGGFLLATQYGYLTVAGVLTSLYPASTVLLAALILHERIHRDQAIGLALCALAIGFVAGG